MKIYKETSNLYEGMENSIIFIEGKNSHALNSFVEKYHERIELLLTMRELRIKRFNIIKPADEGEKSLRNLVLRKCPTLNETQLQEKVEQLKNNNNNSRMLFIGDIMPSGFNEFEATIFSEDEWPAKRGYFTQFLKFIYNILEYDKGRKGPFITNDRYCAIREDEISKIKHEDNNDWLCNDLLADNICYDNDTTISPLHFDNEFNISLPLYPQIDIKLDPLPKSLYILFLNHPEGILLKKIQDYETELKSIYRAVSGRKNPTVIKRMFNSIIDPTDNPLHKNISIIRRSFMSKLSYDIAQNYIPPHGRNAVHNIPLDNSLIEIPNDIFETCC